MSPHLQRFLRIACLLLTLLNTATLVTFVAVFLHVRRTVTAIYSDMLEAPRHPALTAWLLDMQSWIFMSAAALLIAALIAKDFIRPRSVPLALNLMWIIVGSCIGVLILVALFFPMFAIIRDATSGAP